MHVIHIQAKHLIASLGLAAKGDIRYYLNGVFFECWPNETRLVATDGHAMGIFRDEQDNVFDGATPTVKFILPRQAIESLKLTKSETQKYTLTIELDGRAGTIIANNTRIMFETVDGQFPDYRRVVPAKTDGMPGQIDPELLARMKKVSLTLGDAKGYLHVAHNGKGAALVTLHHNNFVGIVMGWRDIQPTDHAWTLREPDQPQAVKPKLKVA
jgi:DNA polymerase III subunit beta